MPCRIGRSIGTVTEIAPTSNSISGVVTYLVTINIDESQTEGLRPGLSASASITVDELDGVLIVPNWAVRLNRDTGEAFVLVKQAGWHCPGSGCADRLAQRAV